MGPDVAGFESEIAKFAGVKHAIGVSSGTDAILLALMALDIKAGDEVLCPTFTFFATAGCIARAGATPVFVDADPITFNLDGSGFYTLSERIKGEKTFLYYYERAAP